MIDELQAAHQQGVDAFLEGDYATCLSHLERLHRYVAFQHTLHIALLAYQRVGRVDDASAAGVKALGQMDVDTFGALLVQMTLGRVDPQMAVEAAGTAEERQQAHCYAGCRLATTVNTEQAVRHLRSAIALGGGAIERTLALQELQRLGITAIAYSPEETPWMLELNELHRRAVELQQSGDLLSAIPLRERTCALARDNFGPSSDLAVLTSLLGELYRNTNQFEDAVRCATTAISIWEQIRGPTTPEASVPWNNLGLALTSLQRFDAAEDALKRALVIDEQAHGPEHPECAGDRHNLAELYEASGKTAEAAHEYEWSASVFFQSGTLDRFLHSASMGAMMLYRKGAHLDAVRFLAGIEEALVTVVREKCAVPTEYLDEVGWVLSHTGAVGLAEAAHRHALALQPPTPETAAGRARSLNCLGSCLGIAGREHEAIEAYNHALQLLGNEGGTYECNVLNNLGGAYLALGRLDEARATFGRLISDQQDRGVGGASLGKSLNNLGTVMTEQSDFEVAEPTLLRALELRVGELGPQHPDTAETMCNLGNLYARLGHYDRATSLLEGAVNALKDRVGTGHPQFATALNNLGLVHWRAGRLEEAEPLLRAAAGLIAERVGQDQAPYATALSNLATLYSALWDRPRAETFHRRALHIKVKALGPAHPATCRTKLNLASLLVEQHGILDEVRHLLGELSGIELKDPELRAGLLGLTARIQSTDGNLDGSIASLQQALKVKRTNFGEVHPSVALTLNNLAETYLNLGRPDLAEPCFREALSIARSHRLPDEQAAYGYNYAQMLGGEGRWREALDAALDAVRAEDAFLTTAFAITSERQRLRVLRLAQTRASVVVSVWRSGFDGQPVPTEVVDVILRRKGLSTEVSAQQHAAILGNKRPDLRPVLEELVAARASLSVWELHSGGGLPVPSAEGLEVALAKAPEEKLAVARLQEKVEALEKRISSELPGLRSNLIKAGVSEIAQALPQAAALVEFLRLVPLRFDRLVTFDSARYVAVVITKTGHALEDLGPAEVIEDAVAAFRNHLVDPASDLPSLSGTGKVLARLVWLPLTRHLEDVQRIFVAPDGELNRVPIELLLDGGPWSEVELSYVTVGRDLLRLGEGTQPSETPPLVLGDPDYGSANPVSAPSSLSEAIGAFDPLPGTRAEAREVAQCLGVKPLLDQEAHEGRLLGSASPSVMHVATHGFFLEDELDKPAAGSPVRDWDVYHGRFEDPMLRSGLALAGANLALSGRPLPVGSGDGLLTARDVLAMDLHRTELVVLSACETGLGHVVAGEGVFGLRRAFATAGARTLVMSLWKVPDEETRLLMVGFYQRVLSGVPRAAALRQAQDELQRTHPHPFYWGAFICQGDSGPLMMARPGRQTIAPLG